MAGPRSARTPWRTRARAAIRRFGLTLPRPRGLDTLHRQVPDAGREALAMLDPARGAIEAPIRAELFGTLRFEAHGRSLGEAHVASVNGPRAATFFPRLRDNMAVLREAHAYIGLQERSGHHVSPAGEWLLDNFHLVSAQVRQIADGLPRRYFRDLPVLRAAHLAGLPRIYGVAWAFVAHTDGAFDDALLIAFLRAYQETRELTLGELWALPTTLRVVLVENLRRLSERVAAEKAARELANLWCDRLDTLSDVDPAPLFASLQARGVGAAFALQVMQRLHADSGPGAGPGSAEGLRVREAVRAALAVALPDPTQAQQDQQIEAAAHNLSVSNAISALRLIGDADWRGLIGQASALMRAMQASPIFRAERDDTQDATLHAIERLARQSGHSELAVTEALLGLMQLPLGLPAPIEATANPNDNAPTRAPSHWLRGAGAAALRHSLGLAPRRWLAWQALRQRGLMPLYMATLTLLPLALTVWLVPRYALPGATPTGLLLTGLLALWPISEAVIAIVNRLISESVPPHRLPRLALDAGIPPEHRVLVVVPVLLSDAAPLPELMQRLAQHHLANPEPHAQFALLSDFADGPHPHAPGDDALLHAARAAVAELSARYPLPPHTGDAADDTADDTDPLQRFVLLHRERRWCESEQCWMGWERKRGKLEALIGWLAGATPSPFIDLGALSAVAPDTPYVLTLDSDTVLPPGTLRELIGVAAHPLNRPRIDPVRRTLTAGHGILQPRVATPLPEPAADTPYHRLFAGQCGVDAYSAASSEVYQDLFEQASFMGKGLLDVVAVHAVLAGRLPEGQVLSHDLLEGAMARCGGVSDIVLMEDAPHHADVASARVQRWTRGDWQLLPLLAQARRHGLRALDVWKMADNLRRSLVAPFSVVLLISSLAGGPLPPGPALLLVALALGGGAVLGAVAGLAPSRDDIALRHFYRVAGAELARVLLATLWQLALLLQQALWLAGAVGQALWRMAVSRRGLLQWTTAAASQASATTEVAGLWRRHRAVPMLAAVLLAALLGTGSPTPLLAVLLCALWAATPLWIAWGSRPLPPLNGRTLDAADRDYLTAVARDTWRLFERHVGAESHHLPPDNVQTVPHLMVATRTSPTNIGLYLLATACARAFGWIDTPELLRRCEATLATLGGLARHRGHFLNWYDTLTLQPLPPAYVSTVDSGNLCGHLLALAQACEGWAAGEGYAAEPALCLRLRAVARRCQQLATEAEFGFLYDPRRRLFHIGYRTDEQQLDPSFYDLLASEARLASLWAVAKGDVPVGHWGALGRPFFATAHDVGLSSWSGSMFEYLMPSLVLAEPPAGALASACRAAVHEQIAFGHAQHLPWGVSECAYAAMDHTLAYQYAPQGVPRLALRRTPPDERVVAPYATALAALFAPHAAVANLRRLEALHARAALGFAEALDYTPERQESGRQHTLVSTFMAHHQGMTLVALANVLLADTPRRWGMADLRIAAVATLLQERVPREVARLRDPTPVTVRSDRRQAATVRAREVVPGETALQPTHLLSNGRYSVALRANGAGWSRCGAADVSRWRDDALRDAHGHFVYLRRRPGAAPVSLTQHPAPDPAAHYHATLHSDRVCLHAEWVGLRSRCTVWVSPEDDIELRRVELWNTTSTAISLELLSMFEVSLSEPRADEAHPAFAKLFIEADWDAAAHALHFSRRPRLATEAGLCAVHFVAHADEHLASVQACTDRAVWLGRHQGAAHPLAPQGTGATEPGAQITGLDPIAALTLQLTVPAHGMVQVTLATAAAASRAELNARVDRYRQAAVVERSSLMSVTAASIRLREARVPSDDRLAIQTLTTAVALLLTRPTPAPGLRQGLRPDAALDRRALWRLGLSGDHPVLVVRVAGAPGMRMVRALVQGLRWWSWGGVACDLVVLNGEPNSYLMPLQLELVALRERDAAELAATPPVRRCTLTLLRAVELSEGELNALDGLARVRLNADGRPLSHHVQELVDEHEQALDARQERGSVAVAAPLLAPVGRAPQGEFDAESGAFSFSVTRSRRPLRPWINVLANAEFGSQVSEAAAGYSWAGNSRLHQLTPWSNDPLNDAAGETFWLQDGHSRVLWNLGPGEGRADTDYHVTHGPGWTTVSHTLGSLSVAATWCVDPSVAVKQVRIVLTHSGPQPRTLRVVGVVEWMLGAQLVDRQSVVTAHQALSHGTVLSATQRDAHAGFGGHTAFAGWQRSAPGAPPLDDWTADRRELFDARGHRVLPDHLGGPLGERVGGGLDPCAAIGLRVVLQPGEAHECVWLLGHGDSPEAALALAHKELAATAATREANVHAHWDALLGVVTVRTPDPLFDALSNRWLLYQTVACRLWARAGFYQAGGAYGFRDQLQDAMALAVVAPGLLRAQLLRAASRQFVEGDVQHWWHAPTGAGVRTHFSDDLLWLLAAALRYVEVTGDSAVWDEWVPFIEGDAIPAGAEDLYQVPRDSSHGASLYEHCARTLDRSLAVGAHGLPLMGSGDWNDGMNRVGIEGRGESVWLGWFLCRQVSDVAPVAVTRGDIPRLARWQTAAEGWRHALNDPAWDGEWFVRAFFDDGSPLGSHTNAECHIDLIAQAWAVLSDAAEPAQARHAMASAERLLIDDTHGLIRLLDPPLAHAVPSAGYIQAYPPGVRENGGQYSHAGVWALMAQAALGDADAAWRSYVALSPAHRSAHTAQATVYALEPYVMAGDVCTQAPYTGRGGWSWYTGSAAWMARASVETICGLHVRGTQVCVRPNLPSHWPSVTLWLQRGTQRHAFTVCAAWASSDIARAEAQGAQRLGAGEWRTVDASTPALHYLLVLS